MKLYKYMSAKSAYDYLHTGGVEVKKCDTHHGVISFSEKPWSTSGLMDLGGIVLEFDAPDDYILLLKGCRAGSKLVQVELSSCKLGDLECLYRISSELRLDAFTIGPDCQITWQYAHSCFEKMGKGDTAIKLLHSHNGTLYVGEEYRTDEQGLYRLMFNLNHPSCRDKIPMIG